jgi:hypothetical protein
MSAFDELERQLRGAAARRRRRLWRMPALAACAAVLLGGTAFAAGEGLRQPTPDPRFEDGAPVPGSARVLALRVEDPKGGAPWGLRVSRTNRSAACVEVGRIDGSAFTPAEIPVVPDATTMGSRAVMICGAATADGLLVHRGTSRLVEGENWIRFGLLGPRAREVRYVTDDGKTLTQAVGEGGAYLFVRTVPPARPTKEHVDGVFADGSVQTVAGHHAVAGRLPGADVYPLPRRTRAKVRLVTVRKVRTVRFKSPVAMTRSDEVFRAYVDPPRGCRPSIPGYQQATNRDYARGERVDVPIGTRRDCHGTFTVSVRYHSQRTGNKRELLVGSVRFTR